jgi:SAM-dependent methyltransferase
MLEAIPGLVEWAHSPDSNAKHDPFTRHAAAISGRLRVMNIRRLPSWVLSMANHRAVHGSWPSYEPHPMPSADEMAESTEADDVLRYMSDGPRFPVQKWLRKEHLADDVAALLEHFGELTEAAQAAIASVPYRAKAYDHDLGSTFTAEQIRRMYTLNPGWAEVERRVYGDLYDLRGSESPDSHAGSRRDDHDEIDVDRWLTAFAGSELDPIDRQLAEEGPSLANYRLFRGLSDWTWALLLGRRYTSYLSILETLPQVPDPALQTKWSGAHGLPLLARSLAFYRHVHSMRSEHGIGTLPTARILDFGCGWGRLTRFFCRDVDPGCLHACDPSEELLEICRRSRLPAVLHRAELAPGELSEDDFDLAYSHSLFTHLSEQEAAAGLEALHEALSPGGLLVLTIRPPAAPREAPATTLPDLRERWDDRFELVDVTVLLEDIDRVAVTLRRR